MSEAFTVTDMLGVVFLGMGIVFLVLIIIYFMMTFMRVIFYHPEKTSIPAVETDHTMNQILEDEDEEAAAVVAVIAACLNQSPSSFRLVNLYK